MAADNELMVRIKGDSSGAKAALKDLTGSLGGTKSAVGGVVNAFAAGAVAIKAADFLGDSLRMAREQQAETAKLQVSIRNTGNEWGDYAGQVTTAENAAVRMGYSDDDMTKALAVLTTGTGSATKAMQDYQLVMDLARYTGKDLATSAGMVAKAESGKIGVIARQLPFLNAQMSKEEALAALRKAVSGQAEAYSLTGAGAADRLTASYEQLQETIGFAVLPVADKLATTLSDLLEGFNALPEPLRNGSVDLVVFGGGAAIALVTAAKLKTAIVELGGAALKEKALEALAAKLAALGGAPALGGLAAIVAIPAAGIAGAWAIGELNKASADAVVSNALAGNSYMVTANTVDEYTEAIIRNKGGVPTMIAIHSQYQNSLANVAYAEQQQTERLASLGEAHGLVAMRCRDNYDATVALTGSGLALQQACEDNRSALIKEAEAAFAASSSLEHKMDVEMAAGDATAQATLARLRVKEAEAAREKAIDADKKHSTEKTRDAVVKANADLVLAQNASKRASDKARESELLAAIAFGKDIEKAVNDLVAYYSKVGKVTAALATAAQYGGYTGNLSGAGATPKKHKARGGFNPGIPEIIEWGEDGGEVIVPLSQKYRDDALSLVPPMLDTLGIGMGGSVTIAPNVNVQAVVRDENGARRLANQISNDVINELAAAGVVG